MTTRCQLVLDAGRDDHLLDIVEANLVDPTVVGTGFFLDQVDAPAPSLTHYVFLEEDGRARVTLVVDTGTPVQYLTIESHDPGIAPRLARALAGNLKAIPPADLRAAAAENVDEEPGNLVRMALGAPAEADPETVDLLVRGLTSARHDTRLAAIEAASLTQWPELEEPLRTAHDAEPDPDLKRFAATALAALRQVTGKS